MGVQSITLNLPEAIFEQIRRAAEKMKRPISDVLREAVAAAAPVMDGASSDMRAALAHLAYLNDAALWQAARATMTAEQRERLQHLHDKHQREKVTGEEQTEEQALLELYRDTLLIRAQATVLLKMRGYDVSDPSQFAPLQ